MDSVVLGAASAISYRAALSRLGAGILEAAYWDPSGSRDGLEPSLRRLIDDVEDKTRANSGLNLIVANRPGVPVVNMSLLVNAGFASDEGSLPGTASLAMNIAGAVLLHTAGKGQLGRRNLLIACALVFAGVWIEKGMGLIVPGFIPSTLGEIVEYTPSLNETLVCFGIWAFGLLVLILALKLARPVLVGELSPESLRPAPPDEADGKAASSPPESRRSPWSTF